MAVGRRKYSAEFKTEVVREVVEKSRPIVDVADEFSVVPQTLGNWVREYRASVTESGAPISFEEKTRVRELERENRELREQIAFLEKAAAFFAQKRR